MFHVVGFSFPDYQNFDFHNFFEFSNYRAHTNKSWKRCSKFGQVFSRDGIVEMRKRFYLVELLSTGSLPVI